MEKVIIAIDPEGDANPVVEAGLKLSRKLNANVVLTSIIPDSVEAFIAASGVPYGAEQWDVELAKVREYLFKIKYENEDLEIDIHTAIGQPRQLLMDFISRSKASFVVLGTHGNSGVMQVFLGGTAEYIVRHSTIPLVIVPFNTKQH